MKEKKSCIVVQPAAVHTWQGRGAAAAVVLLGRHSHVERLPRGAAAEAAPEDGGGRARAGGQGPAGDDLPHAAAAASGVRVDDDAAAAVGGAGRANAGDEGPLGPERGRPQGRRSGMPRPCTAIWDGNRSFSF